jgi:hypothetical protein
MQQKINRYFFNLSSKLNYFFQILKKNFYYLVFSSATLFLCSCSESGTSFYIDIPEKMKRIKMATFYGVQAQKNCEIYHKIYAGYCDIESEPFVTCYDIDEKKYKLSRCQ